MEARENGKRFVNYRAWEDIKRKPYDYERDGLLKHLMSPSIVYTDNRYLKTILDFVENSLIFVMKYVDILKNFKNPYWRNR